MTQPLGYFTFVLHSHLPYVRRAGRWPHGEEMLHEALAETYLPLLIALDDLREVGLNPRLTIGLTPILLEQLADPDVLSSFDAYLGAELDAARIDAARYETSEPALARLARFYERFYGEVAAAFRDRYGRDVVAQFRRLCQGGHIDVLTSAATHGYLPLLARDSSRYAQLQVGRQTSRRHLQGRSQGVWLPECAYRPGLEELLAELNLLYFFTETHVVSGGHPVGKVVDEVVGPYDKPRRTITAMAPMPERTVLRPYYVGDVKVAVFARDPRTGMQVWSATDGYPGDFAYREFHRKDPGSGHQYWRVTGANVDLSAKQLYDPAAAESRVQTHAAHFVDLILSALKEFGQVHGRPGLIVSAYDTELFGHWWFEGVTWLREVLRLLDQHPEIGLITADDYLERHPPGHALRLSESSWGAGGDHSTWLNDQTAWMWPLIHAAEDRMEDLVRRFPAPADAAPAPPHGGRASVDSDRAAVLTQAARELLLLQSSDWPFLVSTGQAAEYATERFQTHLARFNRLVLAAEHDRLDPETRGFLHTCQRADNPFPDLDYRAFAPR